MTLTPLSTPHRITAAVFALLTLSMALLQLNDPDPAVWVAMYSFLALNCLLATVRGVLPVMAGLGLAASVLWGIWLFPSVVELLVDHPAGDLFTGMSPDRPYVEEARESLGLLLASLSMLHLLIAARQRA